MNIHINQASHESLKVLVRLLQIIAIDTDALQTSVSVNLKKCMYQMVSAIELLAND